MMAHDKFFYDSEKGEYTVDKYLDDLEERFGGIDSVLVWPTYPNIGIDNRNQYDLIRSMPGGVEGIKSFVSDFNKRGVSVLFPYNPWDLCTRDEGKPDCTALAELLAEVGAQGFNGDTMLGVP